MIIIQTNLALKSNTTIFDNTITIGSITLMSTKDLLYKMMNLGDEGCLVDLIWNDR